MTDNELTALVPVFAVFALLLAALLFWCLISSCLGTSMSDLWEYTLLGMRQTNGMRTRSRFRSQEEFWEMEYRN